jgi:predicted DNA-binding transcriptional regulator YafY
MKILLEKTDEQNPMTIAEVIIALAAYDIKAERKSLYTDIEILRQFGIDIESQRDKTTRYYVANRQFELPELKLLVDAVQSSRFITEKKSQVLIQKLSSLTSQHHAKQLRRQVFVANRAKALNETVYYSIDNIHQAINEKKKIAFKYFDYNVNKKRIYRKQGELYQTSPVTLCWNDDKYYLIAYNAYYDCFTHYRVDRMDCVKILDETGDKFGKKKWNLSEHSKRVFGMFDEGEIVKARLSFDSCLVNAVIDQFGKDVHILPSSERWFDVIVDVSVSPVFLAWMFQFGAFAEIKAPESLIEAMREHLKENARHYFSD